MEELLQHDVVSMVDLPPMPLPMDAFDLSIPISAPIQLPPLPDNGPAACIVDSGVLAGHPLLSGVIGAEEDFDSGGEHTSRSEWTWNAGWRNCSIWGYRSAHSGKRMGSAGTCIFGQSATKRTQSYRSYKSKGHFFRLRTC